MAVDPNVYALSIQLQLDSSAAFETLEKFSESVVALEQKVSDVAEKAFSEINSIVSSVETSVNSITESMLVFEKHSSNIAVDLGKSLENVRDTNDLVEKNLDFLIKIKDNYEEIHDFQTEAIKFYPKEFKFLEKNLDILTQFKEKIDIKNKGHEEEIKLVREEATLLDELGDRAENYKQKTLTVAEAYAKVKLATVGILNYFTGLEKGIEEFTYANYRAYGSQQQLLQQTRSLTAELGVSSDVAIATYKALADVRTPIEEVDKLAKTIAAANRTSGLNVSTLANYSKTMRLAGVSTDDTQKSIVKITEAMRKFGLNQDDVNKLMSVSNTQALTLRNMLGGPAEYAKYQDLKTVFIGLGKQLGFTAEEALKIDQALSNPVNLMKLQAMTGVAINDTASLTRAIAMSGERFANLQKQIAAAGTAAQRAQLQMQFDKLAEAQLGSVEAAYIAAGTYQKLDEELKKYGKDLNDTVAVQEALARIQKEELSIANATLTGEFNKLKQTLAALWSSALQPVANGLAKILWAINWAVSSVAEFVTWLGELSEKAKKAGGIIGFLISAFEVLAGILVGSVMLVGTLGGSILAAIAIFYKFPKFVLASARAFDSLTRSMVGFAKGVGQSVYYVLMYIGKGLYALGSSVKGVMVELLVLTIALIGVSVSMYILASAVKILADTGWAGAAALVGLTAAVAVLGAVMIFLAGASEGLAPGVGLLIAAMLTLGLTAIMLGYGLKLAAEGLKIIWETITFKRILLLGALGLAINALGAMAIIAAPGIAILAIELFLLGAAMTLLAAAALIFIPMLSVLSEITLSSMAEDILEASGILYNSGTIALEAAKIWMAASLLLLPASLMVLAAMVTMSIASALMLVSAPVLYVSSGILYAASVILNEASIILATASAELLSSSLELIIGSVILLQSGTVLLAASVALLPASLILIGAASALGVAASIFLVTAPILLISSSTIYAASVLLNQASIILVLASAALLSSSLELIVGSAILLQSGTILLAAVITLLPASLMLIGVASALGVAASILLLTTPILLISSNTLLVSASILLTASRLLMSATIILLPTSAYLVSSAVVLKIAAAILLESSILLMPAALIISGASTLLLTATITLAAVAPLLLASSTLLVAGGSVLYVAAGLLLNAGLMILEGGFGVLMGMAMLLAASGMMLGSSLTILLGSAALSVGIGSLAPISVMMIAAGVAMMTGVTIFSMALLMLEQASNIMVYISDVIAISASMIGLGVENLHYSSVLLISAATLMIVGSMTLMHSALLLSMAGILMSASAYNISIGALLLIPAFMTLSGLATILSIVGILMNVGSDQLFESMSRMYLSSRLARIVGMELFIGATYISDAIEMLYKSAVGLIRSEKLFREAQFSISNILSSLIELGAKAPLATLAISALLGGVTKVINDFSKSIARVDIVAKSLDNFGTALAKLSSIGRIDIKDMLKDLDASIPILGRLSAQLNFVAADFNNAVEIFSKPAEVIISILDRLHESITGFSEGIMLADNIATLAVYLNQYATLLEETSERIDTAIINRALPALRAAEQAGLTEAIRSEALTTVVVLDQREGEEESSLLEVLAEAQILAINDLKETVKQMVPGGSSAVNDILTLLQVYLPDMVNKDRGLSTEFNSWAK